MPKRRSNPGNGGFSIVELLVAMFILSVGLLGLATLQVISQSQGTSGRQRGTASFLAHGILDQIQAEAALTAGERAMATDGTVALNGRTFTYIDPVAVSNKTAAQTGPSYTQLGLLDTDPYYTANPTVDKSLIFTSTWLRVNGNYNSYGKIALQEFIVNVSWNEYNATSKASEPKTISVSRYVRL